MLSLSSVDPSFFALTKNRDDEERCRETFESQQMKVSTVPVWNNRYQVEKGEEIDGSL